MFWKSKPLQIELKNPPQISTPITIQTQSVSEKPAPEEQSIDIGLAIKISASLTLFLQGSLVVYGYAVLMGNYDYFGIDINELNISKPTLLLYGYVYSLTAIFEISKSVPTGGAAAAVFICLLLATGVMLAITKKTNTETSMTIILTLFIPIMLIFVAPAKGLQQGNILGAQDLQERLKGAKGKSYRIDQKITTNTNKELKGTLILADTKYSFLLTEGASKEEALVYKLRNKDNSIMRVTILISDADADADADAAM